MSCGAIENGSKQTALLNEKEMDCISYLRSKVANVVGFFFFSKGGELGMGLREEKELKENLSSPMLQGGCCML